MQSRVHATVGRLSVHLSVHISHPAVKHHLCVFAAVGPAAKRYQSIATQLASWWSAAVMPQHGAQQHAGSAMLTADVGS